ncbi:MAG: M6 family metalloprotease domain-containing protein [Muribaculaceae bacterium]|nr:M6 family metalloprotease domain-containing protein [Muribaculaceae bacterium]
MNKKAKATLAGIAVSLAALTATAVPAKPGIITMTQADGTSIEVRLVGDERAHQYFTPDGYLLVNDGEQFYFATVDISGRPVSTGLRADAPRTGEVSAFLARVDREQVRADLNAALDRNAESAIMRGPGLFPESRFPGMGKQKGLVILVEYTDVKFSLSDPHDYFNRMLNEPGFSDYGGTGSAHDFFLESSMGQFDCDFDVVGPVTLPNSMSYYGGNDWGGNDIRPAHMIRDACDLVDDEVDFSQYDRDGDGEIDNVFVFYAGRGEASGGSADTIWPHSWSATYGVGANYYDGKLLDRYACSNEWEGTRPDGVGTFVHEFSHVLGLPDLYATSYTSSFTPGAWSTMDLCL